MHVLFAPTNSHYSFRFLADPEDITRFGPLSPDVLYRHAKTGDTAPYFEAEVLSAARRLATEAASGHQSKDDAMTNITAPGVTLQEESYRGFIISWQKPPMIGPIWSANITTNSLQLLSLMGRNGSQVIEAQTCEQMLTKARLYIDRLLSQ